MDENTTADLIADAWLVLNRLDNDQRALAFELLSVAVAAIIDDVGSIDAEGFRYCIARAADKAEEGFDFDGSL